MKRFVSVLRNVIAGGLPPAATSRKVDLAGELRTIALDSHKDPVFIMADGIIVEANPACVTMFGGGRRDQIIGQKITDRLGSQQPDGLELRASLDTFNKTFALDGVARRLWNFKRLDGSILTARSTLSPLAQAERRCTLAVLEDITLFHAAEQQIRIAEAERTRIVAALAGALSKVAAGNLTVRIDDVFPAEYEDLRRDFNAAVNQLHGTIGSLTQTAATVHANAGEIRAAMTALGHRAVQHVGGLETAAAILDDVFGHARSSAERLSDVHGAFVSTREETQKCAAAMTEAQAAMTEIDRSSRQIGAIVALINEIATQTRLLSLNASVEAARAGEAGSGFGVVANEVRNLAQKAAGAVEQIAALIAVSQRQVSTGSALVEHVDQSFRSVVDALAQMNSNVEAVEHTFSRQSERLSGVNDTVAEMRDATLRNAAMVEEANAACMLLTEQGDRLTGLTRQFRTASSDGYDTSTFAIPVILKKGGPV
ncbi:methyl-accepting chemotaxis protein [Rhizobium hainanense]|uniref:Methyl-accepting chemotaxis protein n=1 Tax=Rhizobium hainanense TaxID=52131 RepID=A0A1C3W8P3_9HYPH|nr:methyl-accepting chemotaxis protein [Rhizobium hainanense]SCB36303.1 methyl-accepting chemotaxis protein [Rhizobium hainanense]